DHQAHIPVGDDRLGVAVFAVGAGTAVHHGEPAEDRARRRSGAAPRKNRQFALVERQPGRARRRQRQRRERRGRRGQPRRRRKIVGALDAGALAEAGARAHEVEELRHAAERARVGVGAVEHERVAGELAVEGDGGARRQPVERERERADGRQIQPGVALAPVLHERNVGVGARDSSHADTVAVKTSKPAARHASETARSLPTAMTQPPPPPPVSLAPNAPASRAMAHMRSISGHDTSSASRWRWFSVMAAPNSPYEPRVTASAPRCTSDSMAAKRPRVSALRSASNCATRATRPLVSRALPVWPMMSGSGAALSAANPPVRVNKPKPPAIDTVWSRPLGLP